MTSEAESTPSLTPTAIARALALSWALGDWTVEALKERTRRCLCKDRMTKLLNELVLGFWRALRDAPEERSARKLEAALGSSRLFHRICERVERVRVAPGKPVMHPAVKSWDVPGLAAAPDLARWLDVEESELLYFSDPRGLANHYHRYWHGSRLVEAPAPRLKAIQRRIASDLLSKIPEHDAAHGFVAGRDALTAVRPHAGRPVVLTADLRAFFPSLGSGRVHGIFVAAGYPHWMSRTLADLCTTSCRSLPPRADGGEVDAETRARYAARHVPPGAPTSPALANLICYRLDARLTGLARSFGVRYTRYADDLIFSGPWSLGSPGFLNALADVVRSEGFELHSDKTRVMTQSVRQQVLGLVVNQRPSIPRQQMEALESWLYRCVRDGVEAHDRGIPFIREHLEGRVAWARHVDPERASKASALLSQIRW